MDIDTSEFRALAADLGKASREVFKEAEKVTEKAAHNIKTTMADDAKSSGTYRHFAGSISYDRAMSVGQIGYEIGPDKDRAQGALGNILYFGTSKNAPVLDVEVGLRKEAPEFEKRIADMAEGLLDG